MTIKMMNNDLQTPPRKLKIKQTEGELGCSWRVSSSCSTSDTRRVFTL